MNVSFAELYFSLPAICQYWNDLDKNRIFPTSDVAIDLINQRKKMQENDNNDLYYIKLQKIKYPNFVKKIYLNT